VNATQGGLVTCVIDHSVIRAPNVSTAHAQTTQKSVNVMKTFIAQRQDAIGIKITVVHVILIVKQSL